MSVARVTEISATSKKSYEAAVEAGIKRASKTLQDITSAWVADHSVNVKKGEIVEHVVRLKVTFILKD